MSRVCKQCGAEFAFRACPTDIASGRGNYCSRACSHAARIKLPQTFVCPQCKRTFGNRYGKTSKFCSKECSNKSKIGSISWNHGKRASPETKLKQSLAKKRLLATGWRPDMAWRRGNPAWNRGLGVGRTLAQQVRSCGKMNEWRDVVFLVWENKCAECKTTEKLHAHHIYEMSHIMVEEAVTTLEQAEQCDRLWDITNGILLCVSCHRATHAKYAEVREALRELDKDGLIERKVDLIEGRPVTSYRAL